MSMQDQLRWNARYAEKKYGQRHHPSALLQHWLESHVPAINAELESAPVAWDVACGTGRNLLYMAQRGFAVVGLDIADVGLEQAAQRLEEAGLPAQFVVHDLELPTLPEQLSVAPQLIVVFRYLNLGLLPRLAARLAVGGRLIVEVHLQSPGAVGGPSSDRFRAAPGAVRQAVLGAPAISGNWVVEHDYEGPITDPDGSPMALAQLVVRRDA